MNDRRKKWELGASSAALSMFLMILVAKKWNIGWRPTLFGAGVTASATAIPFFWLYSRCKTGLAIAAGMFSQITLTLTCAFAFVMLRFWRDPERVSPETKEGVLSAADGKIIYIKTIDGSSMPLVTKQGRDYPLSELMGMNLMDNGAYVIGTEMNILNVHVNRCPVAGQVKLIQPITGQFMSLRREEAPFVNARCTTVIENRSLSVAVVQIASRLVRRVENYLSVSQTVSAGQRLGMIRFGSLVAVVLPRRKDMTIEVQVGDTVTAGVSILARCAVTEEER